MAFERGRRCIENPAYLRGKQCEHSFISFALQVCMFLHYSISPTL